MRIKSLYLISGSARHLLLACSPQPDLTFGDEKWAYYPGSNVTHCTPNNTLIPAEHRRQRGNRRNTTDQPPQALGNCHADHRSPRSPQSPAAATRGELLAADIQHLRLSKEPRRTGTVVRAWPGTHTHPQLPPDSHHRPPASI
ncbi:hypothetical protein NDU88_006050 [Pleurodeles waltl]|uniref:Uncharacterized protein n=1 Tax=Pleurodeles waltl TaxID=8319 RepID=A0AAV7PQB4_PLEWA|nr:hypothetical protein NDU88_006050 [Pleurodeles waltl]